MLLPSLWQAMPPDDRKTAVAIDEDFGEDAWSVEFCEDLIKALQISLADLTLLQHCILLRIGKPLQASKNSLTK
jgi:hypothetical protein